MSLKIVQSTCVVLIFILVIFCLSVALTPAIFIILKTLNVTMTWPLWHRSLTLAFGSAVAFCVFGVVLFFTVGLLNRVLGLQLAEGNFRYRDSNAIKWYFHNALLLLVRAFFIDFMLLTPSANVFYTLMGAKLGKNVHINSRLVADISLIEIGDNTIIGGNATVIAHVFEDFSLKLKKVKIGSDVTIGLNSVIMPGCVIGDGAVIAAGAVLVKDTIVGPNDIFVGIPAESLRKKNT